MTETDTAYIPGMCNINQAEIAYRRKVAYAGIGLGLVILIVMLATGINSWFRIIIFLPLLIGVLNALQVKNKFCVSYAASGQQNATEGSPSAQKVTDDSAHEQDKAKARKMNQQALIASAVITAVVFIIPQ